MEPPDRAPLHLTLLMLMEAYRIQRDQPLGLQSAGAGLMEACLRCGDNSDHTLVVTAEADAAWFHQLRTSEDRRHHTSARLQGWLSKQGLVSQNQEI